MNKREQEQLSAFFEEIYETEEVIDFIKVQLSKSQHYNPNCLFDMLSSNRHHITIQDMRNYLNDKIPYNSRQLYEFFERFDWSRQGYISRNDFLNEITPFGSQLGGDLANGNSAITAEIEGHFISLMVQLSKRLRILQVARRQLSSVKAYDAFSQIDTFKIGLIGINDLRRLFYANDFNVTDRQLYYLMHGLRRRAYKDVTLEVFCQNIDPLQFSYYLAYQNQIQQESETDLMTRSRHEEELIKRSRLQSQRLQHEIQKAERKRQAQLQRQIQIEDGIKAQVMLYEDKRQRQMRKAILEEQKLMRERMLLADDLARRQENIISNKDRDIHLLQMQQIHQDRINQELANSALLNQYTLERSRKLLQRQIQQENMQYRRQALQSQLELSKQRIVSESRRRYIDQKQYPQFYEKNDRNNKVDQAINNKFLTQAQRSSYTPFQKDFLGADSKVQRQKYKQQRIPSKYDPIYDKAQSIRVTNNNKTNVKKYDKQLEQTRFQLKQRKSGISDVMRYEGREKYQ